MKHVILLCILLVSLPYWAQDKIGVFPVNNNPFSKYYYQIWNSTNGLSQNSVNDICQTRDGYLWIATFNGLLRYDGSGFVEFNNLYPEANLSKRISSLHVDSVNNLWITIETGELFRFSNGELHNFTAEYNLENLPVNKFVQLSNGDYYFNSKYSIYKYDGNNINQVEIATDSKDATFHDFSEICGIGLFTISYRNSYLISDKTVKVFQKAENSAISSVLMAKNGTLYIGTDRGLTFSNQDNYLQLKKYPGTPNIIVRSLFEDSDGRIWIGTIANGVIILEDGKFYKPDDMIFKQMRVDKIFEDDERNIWLGSHNSGLIKFKRKAITHYLSNVFSKSAFSVSPIIETTDKSIWIGFNCDGVKRIRNGNIYHYGRASGMFNECVWALYQDHSNHLWLGTYGSGIYRFDGKKFVDYNSEFGLTNYVVFAIFEDSQKNFWVGTYDGVIKKSSDGLIRYTTRNGLSDNNNKVIFEDSKGRIWFGSLKGASYYQDDKFSTIIPAPDIKESIVRSFYEDNYGNIFIGTYGAGIFIHKNNVIKQLSTKNGLADNVVSAMQLDNYGRIWMTSNVGISCADTAELSAFANGITNYVSTRKFGKSDGLVTTEFNGGFAPSSMKAADGKLYFPTVDGIAVVDPHIVSTKPLAPRIYIDKVVIDDTVFVHPESIEVDAGFERIEIFYNAIGLNSPENIKFITRMNGINENWGTITNRKSIYYNYLPSGDFTFEISGTSSHGMWSTTPAQLKIRINQHFYETWWFYLIAIIVLSGIIILMNWYRIRWYKRRQVILQETVDERTRELRTEKSKIEDYLTAQKNLNEKIKKQKIELEKLNNSKDKFFSIISHDLKNPFNTILGYSDLLLADFEGYNRDEIKNFIKEININSNHTFKLLEDLLSWANSQQGDINLDMAVFNLSELIRKNIVLNYGIAKRKEIKIVNDIKAELMVYADIESISTVLRNLISNAIKFSYRNSEIIVSAKEENGKIISEVKDFGSGMDNNRAASLFSLGTRSTPGTEREKGSGLGLIISKEFAIKNGGDLTLKTVKGKGTSFFLTLPAYSNGNHF